MLLFHVRAAIIAPHLGFLQTTPFGLRLPGLTEPFPGFAMCFPCEPFFSLIVVVELAPLLNLAILVLRNSLRAGSLVSFL